MNLKKEDTAIEILEAPSLYVDIALGVPQAEPYQYSVPLSLTPKIGIGKRVRVPLRNQTRVGYIVGTSKVPQVDAVKPILELIDEESYLSDSQLKLAEWIAEYCFCSLGQAIEAAMPAPFKKGKTTIKARKAKHAAEKDWIHAATGPHVLTADQAQVFDTLQKSLDQQVFQNFLLHGVTGSGKTEIYLNLIEKAVALGRGAIVLVPEISLTPQTTDRFESRFTDQVAVMHSRLSQGKRLEEWHRIREGKARVVIGARSAVFSPVQKLGLVIIDEEHDNSYKQGETPRYDARLVAQKRCQLEGSILLQGSATPSLELMFQCDKGNATRLELPKRIGDRPLPGVQIVDMRRQPYGKFQRVFSQPLETAVREALENKEQVILFLNRRGFSPFVSCTACGTPATCPRCRVSLVFHHDKNRLLCHTCNHKTEPPKICPKCRKGYLRYFGMGTEKVESEAHRLFPGARIVRMDADSTKHAGSHEAILRQFRKREVDILLGTQMITKGHDFPGVSVIGVISADTALHLPDFRSAEDTFDLLTQVAGRAGREDIAGRVFVQTYVPDHYAIVAAKDHNYTAFYEKEIAFRRELGLPPHRHNIQVIFYGRDETAIFKRVLEFKKAMEQDSNEAGVEMAGPAPCFVSKRRGMYYWNLYFRGPQVIVMNRLLRQHLKEFKRNAVAVKVDVDPR